MREVCFCGRSGEVQDREPVLDTSWRWALRCPRCGHLDDLGWLPGESAFLVWAEVRRRRKIPLEAA